MGSDPSNVKDLVDLFSSKQEYIIFYNANIFLRMGSIAVVNHRTTHIDPAILIGAVLVYSCYNHIVTYNPFDCSRVSMFIVLIMYLCVILHEIIVN